MPETVGAWLGVWTPPRDVDVPPLPVRKALLWGAGALVVLAAAVALIAPRIDDAKTRRAASEARETAAQRAAQRRLTIAQQRPRFGTAPARPPAGASEPTILGARVALLHQVEAAIGADARRRAVAGELRAVSGPTTCEPYPKDVHPEADPAATTGVYDCLVLLRAIKATARNGGGVLGYPFRAVLDFRRYRYAFCKTNPVPGERMVPDPRTVVELPRACRATR